MSSTDYLAHYKSQHGGGLRFFRGGYQTGAGLGDILRRVFRFIVPVATTGLKTFATNAIGGVQSGMPLASAAKAALGPTVNAMAGPLLSRFMNNTPADAQPPAAGSGEQQKGSGVLFDGIDGIPTTTRAIAAYKRGAGVTDKVMTGTAPPKRSNAAAKKRKTNKDKTISYNF